jgi:hypothetical protein
MASQEPPDGHASGRCSRNTRGRDDVLAGEPAVGKIRNNDASLIDPVAVATE